MIRRPQHGEQSLAEWAAEQIASRLGIHSPLGLRASRAAFRKGSLVSHGASHHDFQISLLPHGFSVSSAPMFTTNTIRAAGDDISNASKRQIQMSKLRMMTAQSYMLKRTLTGHKGLGCLSNGSESVGTGRFAVDEKNEIRRPYAGVNSMSMAEAAARAREIIRLEDVQAQHLIDQSGCNLEARSLSSPIRGQDCPATSNDECPKGFCGLNSATTSPAGDILDLSQSWLGADSTFTMTNRSEDSDSKFVWWPVFELPRLPLNIGEPESQEIVELVL